MVLRLSRVKSEEKFFGLAGLSEQFVEQRLAKSQAEATINPRKKTERLLLEARWLSFKNRNKSSREQSRINQGS